jgi:hypothetical protein
MSSLLASALLIYISSVLYGEYDMQTMKPQTVVRDYYFKE